MSVVHVEGDGQMAFVKGAPSETIGRCTHARLDGEVVPMTDELRERIIEQNDEMSRQALRVLAVCERELPERAHRLHAGQRGDRPHLPRPGRHDRPAAARGERGGRARAHAPASASSWSPATTASPPRRSRAASASCAATAACASITGVELEEMSEDELKAELAEAAGCASSRSVAPEHKMQVVTALKDMGLIVAVTGDGVNDAPALKKADIGVAMGLTGTDVSREAATMILLDDSFASIIKAVEQGRGVYANVKKMVTYIFSHNMAELFPFVFATLGGLGLVPLGALQMLAIDLGSDVLPGLALGTEQPEPGVMNLPPRPERAPHEQTHAQARRLHRRHPVLLRDRGLPLRAPVARLDLGRRSWMNPASPHYSIYREALTMTQAAIVVGQVANGFGCRTERESLFKVGLFTNRFLRARRALRHRHHPASISYVPFVANIFKTGPLTLADWASS